MLNSCDLKLANRVLFVKARLSSLEHLDVGMDLMLTYPGINFINMTSLCAQDYRGTVFDHLLIV